MNNLFDNPLVDMKNKVEALTKAIEALTEAIKEKGAKAPPLPNDNKTRPVDPYRPIPDTRYWPEKYKKVFEYPPQPVWIYENYNSESSACPSSI